MSIFTKFNPWSKDYKNATLADDSMREYFANPTGSGATVNDATALSQGAVYACVRVLSETVASLPLKVYEESGGSRKKADHPLNRLLGVSPNGEQTSFELREFMMTCLNLRGNAYAQKLYSGRGEIGQINPLNAAYMKVDRDKANRLIFDYQEPGNARVFTSDEIWRVAGLGSNGVTGLSPISLARESIGLSIAAEGHGASSLKNGVNSSVILSHQGRLEDKPFKRLQDQLAKNQAGFANAGKPFIIEGGMTAQVVGMTNKDAQFLESRRFQREEIATWFRVPPHMIGILDKATFSNIEQQSIDFVINTLLPWLVRLESSMMRDLLTPVEQQRYFLSHTVEGLLRGDTATRYEAYGKAIDKGWMNRNEARNLENRESVDGLDQFVLPVNVETISEREQRFEHSIVNTLSDQEINAMKQEANKGGADYGERVVNFYARFNAKLRDVGVDADKADEYCLKRVTQIENGKVDNIERRAQSEIASIL